MFGLTLGQLAIVLAPALINVLAMIHVLCRKDFTGVQKAVWLAINVLVPVIGGLAYLIFCLLNKRR